MNILEQLGVNGTYFYQLAIFVFTLIVLTQFIFKDFDQLLQKRDQQTVGGEGAATATLEKASELRRSYELKAREINGDIKSIYDSYREEAAKEYDKIVSAARAQSTKLIEESRQRVGMEVADVARRLTDEVPALSQAIVGRLLSPAVKK